MLGNVLRISMWLRRPLPKRSAVEEKFVQQYSRTLSRSASAGSENRILKSNWGSSSARHRSIQSGLHPQPESHDRWRQGSPDLPPRSKRSVGSSRELCSTCPHYSSLVRRSILKFTRGGYDAVRTCAAGGHELRLGLRFRRDPKRPNGGRFPH